MTSRNVKIQSFLSRRGTHGSSGNVSARFCQIHGSTSASAIAKKTIVQKCCRALTAWLTSSPAPEPSELPAELIEGTRRTCCDLGGCHKKQGRQVRRNMLPDSKLTLPPHGQHLWNRRLAPYRPSDTPDRHQLIYIAEATDALMKSFVCSAAAPVSPMLLIQHIVFVGVLPTHAAFCSSAHSSTEASAWETPRLH